MQFKSGRNSNRSIEVGAVVVNILVVLVVTVVNVITIVLIVASAKYQW